MSQDLNDVFTFTRVVDGSSFSAAARALGVPTSTVSRRVARLEDRLGVRLLQRTTRRLNLTDAGRIYYERAARVVSDLEEADRAVSEMTLAPRGKLRVAAPHDLGQLLWSLLDGFLKTYPDVQVELVASERFVDLVQEGFDVALRGGERPETSSLVVRKVDTTKRVLVASPAYLEAHGVPKKLLDLEAHQCVLFTPWSTGGVWNLERNKKKIQVKVRGRFMVNQLETAKAAAVSGYGIAQLLRPHCEVELASGALKEVIPGACPGGGALWAVYPSRRNLAPTVRAFIDYVVANWRGFA